MLSENIKVKGEVNLKIYSPSGELKLNETIPNLVVDAGKTWIAARMINVGATEMTHIAIGLNNTIASALDTTLSNEIARNPLISTIHSANTITYTTTFNPGIGTGEIVEAAVCNTSTMLCRTTFGIKTKDPLDTMTVTWTITIV